MKKRGAALFTGLALFAFGAAVDMTGQWALSASFDDARLEGGEFDCTVQAKLRNS